MERVFQGETIGIHVGTYTPTAHPSAPGAAHIPAWPTTAPTVYVYHVEDTTATEVVDASMARQHQQTGLHYYLHRTERTGVHLVRCEWTSAGVTCAIASTFNVVANPADPAGSLGTSHGSGMLVSIYEFDRPEVTHIVWETDNGELAARPNPA